MRSAAGDLAQFPDDRLFKELSEGIPLVVQNAISLDETARRLYQEKEYQAYEIIRGFAEEEAAKVLILIDFVRCPRVRQKRRAEILKGFYSHVTKRIYAMACSYPNIWTFKELREFVERYARPIYLEGPNWVDWIFRNEIIAEREQTIYVDYLQDVTVEAGDYFWMNPGDRLVGPWRGETPDCVKLSQALSEAGANSPDGLAVIADIWRGFEPEAEKDRTELQGLIADTLGRLAECGHGIKDESVSTLIISSWSFPLWPLTIKEPRRNPDCLKQLREERNLTIDWIQRTEAKRDPPPAISRSKVEALSKAYATWMRDVDRDNASDAESKKRGLRFGSSKDMQKDLELPSYRRVKDIFRHLTEEERAALLALAWFARERVAADWTRIYERARDQASTLHEGYQIGQGRYWRAGLDRWEEKPGPFKVGRLYRT